MIISPAAFYFRKPAKPARRIRMAVRTSPQLASVFRGRMGHLEVVAVLDGDPEETYDEPDDEPLVPVVHPIRAAADPNYPAAVTPAVEAVAPLVSDALLPEPTTEPSPPPEPVTPEPEAEELPIRRRG